MTKYIKCDKCKEYNFISKDQKCNCKLFILIDEEDEKMEFYGSSEQEVALKYAERSNVDNDYYLMDNDAEIEVNGIRFSLSARPDIHYSANEIK